MALSTFRLVLLSALLLWAENLSVLADSSEDSDDGVTVEVSNVFLYFIPIKFL